jgi:hypothetical protein
MGDSGPAAPTDVEETLAASVAQLAQDLMEASSERVADVVERMTDVVKRVSDALGALLDADGASKPVKELLEDVGNVVANIAQALDDALGALLGGHGIPGSDDKLFEQVGNVVANIAQALDDALGALLPGGSDAPDPASNLLAPPRAFYGLPERATKWFEQAGTEMTNLARAPGGVLRADAGHNQIDKPSAPPPPAPPVSPPPGVPPPPVPVAPGGPAPASSSYFGASGSSADTLELPFAILVLLSGALLQGGKRVCQRREPLRPHSALRLVGERPG